MTRDSSGDLVPMRCFTPVCTAHDQSVDIPSFDLDVRHSCHMHPKKRFRTMTASRYEYLHHSYHSFSIYRFLSSSNPLDTHPMSLTKGQPILCIVGGQRLSGPILHQLLKLGSTVSEHSGASPSCKHHQPCPKSTKIHQNPPKSTTKSTTNHQKQTQIFQKIEVLWEENPHRSAGSSSGSCDLCRVAGARSTAQPGTGGSKEPRAAGTRRSTARAPLVRNCLETGLHPCLQFTDMQQVWNYVLHSNPSDL